MENGRSPVLGPGPSACEGAEPMMEGAAAAPAGPAEFLLPSDGHQESPRKSAQTPPARRSASHLAEGGESAACRPPALHKQPPALLPKPFGRLPNHIAGGPGGDRCLSHT